MTLLFSSCSQYDNDVVEGQNFDYSLFNEFKTTNIDFGSIINKNKSATNQFESIINAVNSNLNTDVVIPESVINLVDKDAEIIFEQGLQNNWLSQSDVEKAEKLISDIEDLGFDQAINNYEQIILNSELSTEEFAKQNNIVNILKSQNFANPNIYNSDFANSDSAKGWCDWCKCAAAGVALVVATANLASCVTIAACGLAIVLVYAASNSVASMCEQYL